MYCSYFWLVNLYNIWYIYIYLLYLLIFKWENVILKDDWKDSEIGAKNNALFKYLISHQINSFEATDILIWGGFRKCLSQLWLIILKCEYCKFMKTDPCTMCLKLIVWAGEIDFLLKTIIISFYIPTYILLWVLLYMKGWARFQLFILHYWGKNCCCKDGRNVIQKLDQLRKTRKLGKLYSKQIPPPLKRKIAMFQTRAKFTF